MKLTKKEQKLYHELLVKWCVNGDESFTSKENKLFRRLNKKRNKPTKEQASLLASQTRAFYLFNEAMQHWTDCVKATNKAYNS